MNESEKLFSRVISIKDDIQILASIVQNTWEVPPSSEFLGEWSDNLDKTILKLLDVKQDVLELLT